MSVEQQKQYKVTNVYNPIIEAAKSVFTLANAMKNSTTQLSVDNILFKFSTMIEDFEAEAEKNGAPYEMVKAAQYCLCTFVDESAVRSDWANESWSQKSLLVSFFDETWGGERFFEILEKAKLDVDKNLYLIEFIYLCLQFGYKGKYQVIKNGDTTLEQEKKKLLTIIDAQRPDVFNVLLNSTSDDNENNDLEKSWHIPLWVIAVLICLSIGLFYIVLRWSLGDAVDETSTKINNLSLPQNAKYKIADVHNVQTKRLAPVLQSEIDRGLVEVRDYPDRSVVIILGDGLFESGSEKIQDIFFPVLATVGQAIENVKGQVVVTGYTDSTPIQSINFPSNWHLSQARADEVKTILLNYVSKKDRIRAEGRGTTSPTVPNISPENKAKNRRVEITVYSVDDNNLNSLAERNAELGE